MWRMCLSDALLSPHTGTLLGSVRNASILPWETDLDLMIHNNDYNDDSAWARAMEERGYLVFHETVLRDCKRSDRPWQRSVAGWPYGAPYGKYGKWPGSL